MRNDYKVNNLKVTDKLFRVAATSLVAVCGTVLGFAHFGRHPLVVDKDVRYLTSPYPSRSFEDDYSYQRVISESDPWVKLDDSNYARVVKKYNGNYHSTKELEKIVKTANKEGKEILVEKFGEPVVTYETRPYVSNSELENGKNIKLSYFDEDGEFVVEDESFKDNLISTVGPLGIGLIAGFLTNATYEDEKKKSKVR